MPAALPYFRLRPYVFLVKGAARCALYDLHRRRVFPIPVSAGYVLERCAEETVADMLLTIDDQDDRATAREYLEELAEMDFGRYHEDIGTLVPFDHSVPEYTWGQLLWLSVDLRTDGADQQVAPNWQDLLQSARQTHGCRQLTAFVSGEVDKEPCEMAVVESGAALNFHHVELVFPETACSAAWESLARRCNLRVAMNGRPDPDNTTFRRLQEAQLKVRFSQPAVPTAITKRMLICDHDSFRRLRHCSVHCNSLHINPRGDVFPWVLEKHHFIGRVTDGASLTRLIGSAELRRVWGYNKDSVDQCRECEFRYACPHSYTFRKEPGVVGSAPISCDYDPVAGRWRKEECEGLFCGSTMTECLRQTTKYFDVFFHERKPIPEPYLPLLDSIVECAVNQLGIPKPHARLRYLYYPNLSELESEVSLDRGTHMCGLTESDGNGILIRTAHPGHAHEVLHALLLAVNPEPRFFVSEACATLLGNCWGSEEDTAEAPSFSLEGSIRAVDHDGIALPIERCLLLRDENGLLLGPLRQHRSVHAVARYLMGVQGVRAYLHSWFDALDEASMPGYFYELGGSFFFWLIQMHGKDLFLEFYRSKQCLRHLEGYYKNDIATLTRQWETFLREMI